LYVISEQINDDDDNDDDDDDEIDTSSHGGGVPWEWVCLAARAA